MEKETFVVLSHRDSGVVCYCSRACPPLTDTPPDHGLGPLQHLSMEATPRLAYAHSQLGDIFEMISKVPNCIKTKIKLCGLSFQGLGMYILGADFHEKSICTVAETLPR